MVYRIDPPSSNTRGSGLFVLFFLFGITMIFVIFKTDPELAEAGKAEKPRSSSVNPVEKVLYAKTGLKAGISNPEYTPLPLVNAVGPDQQAVGFALLSDRFIQPPESLTSDNFPFLVSPSALVVETESETSANPSTIFIYTEIANPTKVGVLINLCYGSPRFNGNQPVAGTVVGRVTLYSDQGSLSFSLVAGEDLREWVFSSLGVVNSTGSQTQLVFKGQHNPSGQEAGIDLLTLTLPAEWADDTLKLIVIEDLSQELFSSPNPGLMIFGITVETTSPGN